MLDEALLCARQRGWLVFPCDPKTKKPLTEHGVNDATRDEILICKWWSKHPSAMIGVRCGKDSGFFLTDLDVDSKKQLNGISAFTALCNGRGLPDTIIVATPRGGQHLQFKWVDGIKNRVGGQRKNDALPRGVDIRGEGGYAIVPPSKRADGREYVFLNDDPNGPADAPGWLLELLRKDKTKTNGASAVAGSVRSNNYAIIALERECAAVVNAQPGTRNQQLNNSAFNLGQLVADGGLDDNVVRQRLYDAAVACGYVQDDGPQQTINTINSGLAGGMAKPRRPAFGPQPSSSLRGISPPPPPPPGAQPSPSSPGPQPGAQPATIEDTLKVFREWLLLDNDIPVLAMLGTIAANRLPGDAIWLGIIAPPSSAKTEMLITLAKLPNTEMVGTLSVAGLLSGTPRRQQTAGARGGLLQKIGAFGFLVLKDFGSILSLRPDTKLELLAALREIYDGKWTRVIGADGGKVLSWSGKIGVLFGCTRVYDSYYGVINELGDRFLLCRMEPNEKQFLHAIKHANRAPQMRAQLVEAVTNLFAAPLPAPRDISDKEINWLNDILQIAVRLRGAVKRDYRTRELEDIYGAEGPARFGKALERVLAGLDCLGVKRSKARTVVRAIAFDSVPPNRLRVYQHLKSIDPNWADTTIVGKAVSLPTKTTRRVLEELVVYGLAKRDVPGPGKADLWRSV